MPQINPLSAGALAVLAAGCAPSAPQAPRGPIPELAGKTAGTPQRCVRIESTGAFRIADDGTILYSSGSTVWVNRTSEGCRGIRYNDIPVTEPIGSEHCRGDVVRTIDRYSGIPGPACVLGDFVPYRR